MCLTHSTKVPENPYNYQNMDHFQQFNQQLINLLLEAFSPTEAQSIFYKYTDMGWNISDSTACSEVEYFDVHQTKLFNPVSTKGYAPDYAAGARAVACIELRK